MPAPRITPERAAELARLCAAATPGPWNADNGFGGKIDNLRADMEFTAASRSALPDLLADLADARAALDAERASLAWNLVDAARAEATVYTTEMLVAIEAAADKLAPGWRAKEER